MWEVQVIATAEETVRPAAGRELATFKLDLNQVIMIHVYRRPRARLNFV